MSALSTFVDEIRSDLSRLGVLQERTAWLRNSVDADDLNWLLDASDSVAEGVAEIEDEQVYIRTFAADGATTIAPDGRGWNGTTAAGHAANTRIRLEPQFPRKSVEAAINRTIERCYPMLWGVATEDITVTGSQNTYELPEEAIAVTSVMVESIGPSGVWYPIRNFAFDGHADATDYPSGKTVTIPSGSVLPGRGCQVIIRTKPVALVAADDDFTDSGLQATAKTAVRLGAMSDLMRTVDPLLLSTHSAAADEYDSKRGYGTATKIANDLEAQFQLELRSEVKRLRALYPATIHRKRF